MTFKFLVDLLLMAHVHSYVASYIKFFVITCNARHGPILHFIPPISYSYFLEIL